MHHFSIKYGLRCKDSLIPQSSGSVGFCGLSSFDIIPREFYCYLLHFTPPLPPCNEVTVSNIVLPVDTVCSYYGSMHVFCSWSCFFFSFLQNLECSGTFRTLTFFFGRRNLNSSLCCLETKLTAAYSSRAEKTKSRHTAIQMSMAFT